MGAYMASCMPSEPMHCFNAERTVQNDLWEPSYCGFHVFTRSKVCATKCKQKKEGSAHEAVKSRLQAAQRHTLVGVGSSSHMSALAHRWALGLEWGPMWVKA